MKNRIDTTTVLEELIRAVSGELAEAIRGIGVRPAASALVDELLHRCSRPNLDGRVDFHLKVTFEAEQIDYVVEFGDESLTAELGVPSSPWARIEITIEGLAKALFGRPSSSAAIGWVHEALQVPSPETRPAELREMLKIMDGAIRANNALLSALSPRRVSLEELAYRFGTDKWGTVHWYTPHYEEHFGAFIDERVRVLEIGIGGYDEPESGGASLRMWQQYFRRGVIYGLDVHEKRIDGPRIRTLQGDQGDRAFLRQMSVDEGPFDIIIDDGSHLNRDVLASFDALFPLLKDGGLYVIEDLQTSYWPAWGGALPDRATNTTSIGFLKTLIDGLHHREIDVSSSYLDQNVIGLHFYHNLAFIAKGPNRECGAPPSVRDLAPGQAPASSTEPE